MRPAAPGAQGAPAQGYPAQGGFPSQPAPNGGPNGGYDPQHGGYSYPQGQPGATTAPQGSRQGLSGLDPAQQGFANPGPQRGFAAPQGGPAPAGYRQAPAAPFAGAARQPETMTAAAGYDQWSVPMPGQDTRGYDLGNYMPSGMGQDELGAAPQQQADWSLAAHGYDPALDPAYQTQLGYDGQGGALEQPYPEEHAEYDTAEPRRGSWALRIAGAIVVAVGLGYGLAQGYKMMLGGPSADGATPVVRSDDAPTKTKPTDPGGKQFAHTDSKVMGRLGEPPPSADPSSSAAAEPPAAPESAAAPAEGDPNGARKVTTVMVGRDGSIMPPEAPSEPGANASAVTVPGVTMVDGYGGNYPGAGAQAAGPPKDQAARHPVVVNPPAAEQPAAVVASAPPSAPADPGAEPAVDAAPAPPPAASTAETGALPAPKHPKVKKVAVAAAAPMGEPAAAGDAAAAPSAGGANGYVVVLASVPASGQSRLVALKKFADMQQQYGTVLQNKTPDVREANLGQKGIYHRLLVGPPGSRAQASTLCTELKTAGYKDCWVTAY